MTNIALIVIGDGRKDKLSQTIASLQMNLVGKGFVRQIMINDSGDPDYHGYLTHTYPSFEIISHDHRRGLSGAIQSAWKSLNSRANGYVPVDYVFHLEEDFIFDDDLELMDLVNILHTNPHLAQVSMKRGPVNQAEEEAGGWMQQNLHLYTQRDGYVEQNHLFTLNPCLYPANITIKGGWPSNGGEREFTDHLHKQDPDLKFGILGTIDDPPLVTHIGSHRSEGWKL